MGNGRRIWYASFPRYGGVHMFYFKHVTDTVFRLTRERIGTEGWYRRLLCMHVRVEPQVDAGRGDQGDVLRSLRMCEGVEYPSYYEALRARGLVTNEYDAEVARREAVEYGDTPQTLVVLLCTMTMGDYDCHRL